MKPKLWFVVGGVLLVIGMIIALNVFVFSGTSAASYVAKQFTRDSSQQYGNDVRAYTSSKKPTEVVAMIVDEWRPISQSVDGSGVYLRYSDDAIVIRPRGSGSLILVMDDDRAYRTYYGHVGGVWGWTSTHGESFRGRGPGVGK
ncbi:MAG: DUF4247 domain-containing protein [Haloechinothrix sp.]